MGVPDAVGQAAAVLLAAGGQQFGKTNVRVLRSLLVACKARDEERCRLALRELAASDEMVVWGEAQGLEPAKWC